MIGVIKTGGKQYLVKKGDKIKVEKLEGNEGDKVQFSEVLFLGDEKEVKIGDPFLKGAAIEGKILKQKKDKKVSGVKHNPKKRYLVHYGHRQDVTEVEIVKV
ncbi:MAG: 50S ribosomal protein L21 [Parcubacteria group bacterium]|jgi:large subunit ribosomal protein L21